eukprot:510321_1
MAVENVTFVTDVSNDKLKTKKQKEYIEVFEENTEKPEDGQIETIDIQTEETMNDIQMISNIKLMDEIKGALIFKVPLLNYTMRIYLHYWIFQIPVLITNIILFCGFIMTHNIYPVCPVFLSILVRDKIFLWAVYFIVKNGCFCGCTQIGRYHISRLADCIGGLHLSLSITAFIWNTIHAIVAFTQQNYEINVISVTAFSVPFLMLIICVSAFPYFRYYYHNSFEIVHRYLNWLTICLVIIHIVFVNYFVNILVIPTIFTSLLIILTVYPWLILHRIRGKDIEIIRAGSGESIAYIFPFWSPMGAVCKISTNCVQFHVMGITPLPYEENKGHRCFFLMKSLGDWSLKINNLAKIDGALDDITFYMSRIKPPNFTQGLFNWKRCFILATGIGIAPLIPYVLHSDYVQTVISLVWVGRDHAYNYPKFIVDTLVPLDNVTLYDTTKMERLNLCTFTVQKAKEFDAEAVFIVSNPKIAYLVANYVRKNGIPVFASNFDV